MRLLPQPDSADLDLVRVLGALADPVRLELVRALLGRREPMRCGPDRFDVEITAATLSHHWKVLRDAGVISTFASGRNRLVQVRGDDLDHRFPGLLTAISTEHPAAIR
ncbi:ArsR/SmtB family transcription factor [Nocardia arthritidis]|uniref:ArsR/SmtB family transcription factor n=1 Tax=Nocardia arthritidis TaxID=228602 RepID=UPI00142DCDD3|nr:helix-turn-helix domain-containing protein [Nocardia arthritidis]